MAALKPGPVELPFCEVCGAVGAQPNIGGYRRSVAFFCTGKDVNHRRTRMVPVPYVPLDGPERLDGVDESEESK